MPYAPAGAGTKVRANPGARKFRVTFAGGVGEHGRNCFLVDTGDLAFLVDCGVLAGVQPQYPLLSQEQIRRLRYVFLTHSHADHTGALGWLARQGFAGTVIASGTTLAQLGRLPLHCTLVEDFVPTRGLALRWGRAGHCAGSVWFAFALAGQPGRLLLFSGDYIEDSLIYAVDPIRETVADLAVLDSAYGPEPRSATAMRRDFLAAVRPCAMDGRPVLFPVPKYGRGPELLRLLAGRWPGVPLYGDDHFRRQVDCLARDAFWVLPQARSFLQAVTVLPLGDTPPKSGFCFVSSPQLRTPGQLALAQAFASAGGVVLTGNVEQGAGAWQLLEQGSALFARVPVHCTDRDRLSLQRRNRFAQVVPFHSDTWPCRERTMTL